MHFWCYSSLWIIVKFDELANLYLYLFLFEICVCCEISG